MGGGCAHEVLAQVVARAFPPRASSGCWNLRASADSYLGVVAVKPWRKPFRIGLAVGFGIAVLADAAFMYWLFCCVTFGFSFGPTM